MESARETREILVGEQRAAQEALEDAVEGQAEARARAAGDARGELPTLDAEGEALLAEVDGDVAAFHRAAAVRGWFPKWDWSGMVKRGSMTYARVAKVVADMRRKMRAPINVIVTANPTTLRQRAPTVYADFKARDPGFDTRQAYAVMQGDTVIVFADEAVSDAQVRFSVAHETAGHVGMRAIVADEAAFHEVLRAIDASDPAVRADADRRQQRWGIGRLEAVEEALADQAAAYQGNLWIRLWTLIKDGLNRLGIEFSDDLARVFLAQSRRYVREGRGDPEKVMRVLRRFDAAEAATASERTLGAVRYQRSADTRTTAETLWRQDSLNTPAGGIWDRKREEWRNLQAAGVGRTMRTFLANTGRVAEWLQTMTWLAERSEGGSRLVSLVDRYNTFVALMRSHADHQLREVYAGRGSPDEVQMGAILHAGAMSRSAAADTALGRGQTADAWTFDGTEYRYDSQAHRRNVAFGTVSKEAVTGGGVVFPDALGQQQRTRIPGLTDRAWRMYRAVREHVGTVAAAQLKQSLVNANAARDEVLAAFSAPQGAALTAIQQWYAGELYADRLGPTRGVKPVGLAARTAINGALEGVARIAATGRTTQRGLTEEQVAGARAAASTIGADTLSALRDLDTDQVRDAVARLQAIEVKVRREGFNARRTTAGGYVPFWRRGDYQVNVIAVATGTDRPVPLAAGPDQDWRMTEAWRSAMPWFHTETDAAAERVRQEMGTDLARLGPISVLVENVRTGEKKMVQARLETRLSRTHKLAPTPTRASFADMLDLLDANHVDVPAEMRERLVSQYAEQQGQLAGTLKRFGTPGYDKDVSRNIAEWTESAYFGIARDQFEGQMAKLFRKENRHLWTGSLTHLADLEAAVREAADPQARKLAQVALDKYRYKMEWMAAEGTPFTVDGTPRRTRGRGEELMDQGRRMYEWIMDHGTTDMSTEDWFNKGFGGQLKMLSILAMLGGSVATASLNYASLAVNALPYLAEYNAKRGYGGGHGYGASARELTRASGQLARPKYGQAEVLEDMAGDRAALAKAGLTAEEARALALAIRQGRLQAAMYNQIVGLSKGSFTSKTAKQVIETWMWMFQYTEQSTRRAVWLAAYRLERQRGGTPEQAVAAANDAVSLSIGEYAMWNRPEFARGSLAQYIYVFKQYVVTSVQNAAALPARGKAVFAAMLILMGGFMELPFMQDVADVINTILAALGLKREPVEKAIHDFFEAALPGSGQLLMHGGLNALTGATFSTRVGFGNLIPGTSIALPGVSTAREVEEIAGPVWSGLTGAVKMGTAIARQGAEAVVPGIADTPASTIARDSPITALRNVWGAMLIAKDGEVVDRGGRLVMNDMGWQSAVWKALGFSPWSVSDAYEKVRWIRQIEDDARSNRSAFVMAAVRARRAGDRKALQEVYAQVRKNNAAVRKAGLNPAYLIRNFNTSVNRAMKEADKPLLDRALSASSRQVESYWRADLAYGFAS